MADERRLQVVPRSATSPTDTLTTLGLTLGSATVGSAVPRRTEVTIPYRSSTIDLSRINGLQTYDDRTLSYKFWKRCKSRSEVLDARLKCERWFLDISKINFLYDSVYGKNRVDGYDTLFFVAACTSVDFSETTNNILRVTVTLKADPYLYDRTGKAVTL